jgi:hypothetical protein
MIQKLIPYILNNYNHLTGEWNNQVVPGVNDYPHAPWWTYTEPTPFTPKNRAEMIEHYDANTNAALAAAVIKYGSLVPAELCDEIKAIPTEKILSGNSFGEYDMKSLLYFVNELKDSGSKNELLKKLMGDGNLISIFDTPWGTESALKLCQYIDSPEHPYYNMYKADVERNLDYIVNSQQPDGSWHPSWSWGEPEVWERVKKRIQGLLTAEFLLALKKFGRIDF